MLGAVFQADLPNRRSIRLRDYDYAAAGPYFVTLCAYRGRGLFGQFINGRVIVTPVGQIVQSCWDQISSHFPGVTIDAHVIMPNHFHGVLLIHEPGTAPKDTRGEEGAATACRIPTSAAEEEVPFAPILHEGRTREDFASPVNRSLPTILRSFKSAVTRQAHRQPGCRNARIWQRGYYEHIIRSARSLEEVRCYIAQNPLRWPEDPEHPVFVHDRLA